MKVVSLIPAATEIVCSLGLRDHLVARSHECDFPAGVEALPALTRARVDSSLPSAEIDEQARCAAPPPRRRSSRFLPLAWITSSRMCGGWPAPVASADTERRWPKNRAEDLGAALPA